MRIDLCTIVQSICSQPQLFSWSFMFAPSTLCVEFVDLACPHASGAGSAGQLHTFAIHFGCIAIQTHIVHGQAGV